MIHCKTVVKMESLHLHGHCDVIKILCTNVKVTWHSVELEIAFETTPLLLLEFFLSTSSEVLSRYVFLSPRLDSQIVSLLVKPVFV